ncbi:FtsK/SpoIIIE domain-containing protein [Nonomuraea sp. NPDC049152]|uniref:FtsK/SpoIIIE domain-containing protein n=1 Tax=Nonomuraea sp. NPDC049152 TaxID=3154350 RepID=UPI0033E34E3C
MVTDRLVLVAIALAAPIPALPIPGEPSIGPVEIGKREDGQRLKLKILGGHILIAGATGAGKSSFLWDTIRGLLPAMQAGPVEIWALDPKLMELSFGRELFTRSAPILGSRRPGRIPARTGQSR